MIRNSEMHILYIGNAMAAIYCLTGNSCSTRAEIHSKIIGETEKSELLKTVATKDVLVVIDQQAESIELEKLSFSRLMTALMWGLGESLHHHLDILIPKKRAALNVVQTINKGVNAVTQQEQPTRLLTGSAILKCPVALSVERLGHHGSTDTYRSDLINNRAETRSEQKTHREIWHRETRVTLSADIERWLGMLVSMNISVLAVTSGGLFQEMLKNRDGHHAKTVLDVSLQPSGEIRHSFYQQGYLCFSRLLSPSVSDGQQLVMDINRSRTHIEAHFKKVLTPTQKTVLVLNPLLHSQLSKVEWQGLSKRFELIVDSDKAGCFANAGTGSAWAVSDLRKRCRRRRYSIESHLIDANRKNIKRRKYQNVAINSLSVLVAVYAVYQGWRVANTQYDVSVLNTEIEHIERYFTNQSEVLRSGEVMRRLVDLSEEADFRSRQLPLNVMIKIATAVSEYSAVNVEHLFWKGSMFDKELFSGSDSEVQSSSGSHALNENPLQFQISGSLINDVSSALGRDEDVRLFSQFVKRLETLLSPAQVAIIDMPFGLNPDNRFDSVYLSKPQIRNTDKAGAEIGGAETGSAVIKNGQLAVTETLTTDDMKEPSVSRNSAVAKVQTFIISITLLPHEWQDRFGLYRATPDRAAPDVNAAVGKVAPEKKSGVDLSEDHERLCYG